MKMNFDQREKTGAKLKVKRHIPAIVEVIQNCGVSFQYGKVQQGMAREILSPKVWSGLASQIWKKPYIIEVANYLFVRESI